MLCGIAHGSSGEGPGAISGCSQTKARKRAIASWHLAPSSFTGCRPLTLGKMFCFSEGKHPTKSWRKCRAMLRVRHCPDVRAGSAVRGLVAPIDSLSSVLTVQMRLAIIHSRDIVAHAFSAYHGTRFQPHERQKRKRNCSLPLALLQAFASARDKI